MTVKKGHGFQPRHQAIGAEPKMQKIRGWRMNKYLKNSRKDFIIVILFLVSAIIYGIVSDFPKVLSGYPDELRYVGIGRSLLKGQGLRLHEWNSDFQKILYSIYIMPALSLKSTAGQIRAIGYMNSFIISSSIFPIYKLCQSILKGERFTRLVILFWMTFPSFVYTMYFMSEVIFVPLSLWIAYCVWCIFCADAFGKRLRLNFALGILCYITYLNKEVALYYVISYIVVYMIYFRVQRMDWKKEMLCLAVFLFAFTGCFLLMKGTLFHGLKNSYSNSNLQIFHLELSAERLIYLLYGFVYNMLFAVLAFGIFSVFIPIVSFQKQDKLSWFFLFLLVSFLIGCATIAYMITLPEDFGSRSPRQHIRYLEPLIIPFLIVMIRNASELLSSIGTEDKKKRKRILVAGVGVFLILFVLMGAGGASFLADNSTLLYYELFARFLCKSNIVLTVFRILIAAVAAVGLYVFCKKRDMFLWLFCIIFIGVNIVNDLSGGAAGHYRYGIQKERREQASQANEYLRNLEGNILLISIEGTSPEDKRLFDTYMDCEIYVMNIDALGMDVLLEDSVIDLASEGVLCDISGRYYPDLPTVDYLVVMDDYNIRFMENSVEQMADFPLDGYSLYKNMDTGKIHIL